MKNRVPTLDEWLNERENNALLEKSTLSTLGLDNEMINYLHRSKIIKSDVIDYTPLSSKTEVLNNIKLGKGII